MHGRVGLCRAEYGYVGLCKAMESNLCHISTNGEPLYDAYTMYLPIREVRPLTWNYEAVLLVGKFPYRFSLSFFSLFKFIEVLN